MNLIKKKIIYKNIKEIFAKYVVENNVISDEDLSFLYDLTDYFRPKNPKAVAEITLRQLLDHLIEFDQDRKVLSEYISNVLDGRSEEHTSELQSRPHLV